MHVITRRGLLAAGTLAAAVRPRKSRAEEEVEHLRPFSEALTVFDPPRKPPSFSFRGPDGATKTLADFAGKGVVLNLWATWCPPCVAELPSLNRAAAALQADGVEVLPLSSDRRGAAAVEAFYARHGITHLGIWLDPDGDALHTLGARGLPTTFIIDRTGQERARVEGGTNWTAAPVLPLIRRLTGPRAAQDKSI